VAKKVVSFGLDPAERAQIAASIKARKAADPISNRELDFSKWMREAVAEKLAAERPTAKSSRRGKKTKNPSKKPIPARPIPYRAIPAEAAHCENPPSFSTPSPSGDPDAQIRNRLCEDPPSPIARGTGSPGSPIS